MSYNRNQSRGNSNPFCKVCFDAGKPESQYTSHFVKASRELGAAVICPTILAQECRYCHELGHTPSCCPKLANEKKSDERAVYAKAKDERTQAFYSQKPVAKTSSVKASRGLFGAFASSSEDEDLEPVKRSKKQPTPTPAPIHGHGHRSATIHPQSAVALTWASRIILDAKPKPEVTEKLDLTGYLVLKPDTQFADKKARKCHPNGLSKATHNADGTKRSWADMDDSDDEDEDELQQSEI